MVIFESLEKKKQQGCLSNSPLGEINLCFLFHLANLTDFYLEEKLPGSPSVINFNTVTLETYPSKICLLLACDRLGVKCLTQGYWVGVFPCNLTFFLHLKLKEKSVLNFINRCCSLHASTKICSGCRDSD